MGFHEFHEMFIVIVIFIQFSFLQPICQGPSQVRTVAPATADAALVCVTGEGCGSGSSSRDVCKCSVALAAVVAAFASVTEASCGSDSKSCCSSKHYKKVLWLWEQQFQRL